MKRYSTYKDSGVKWIGEIPSHWERRRNKDIMSESKDIVGNKADNYTLLSLSMNGVIVRDVSEGKGKFPKDFGTYKIVRPNQMVFCLFDIEETPRTVGLVKSEGMLTGAYNVFDLHDINEQYIYYYYESIDDRKALKPLYRGLRKTIPMPSFMSMPIYLPPIQEQRAIVSFLDTELGKIDTYMDKERQLIERLKELKQSAIARAVTRGINPNVKMKPSGINWIGEIPEHWKVKSLRNFLTITSEKGYPEEQLLSVVREQGVIIRNVDSKEENHNFVPDDLSGYKLVKEGQFVINKMKAWQGSYAVSGYRGIVSPAYYTCDLKFVNKEYFNVAVRSKAYVPFFTQYSKGIRVGQWDLSPIGLKEIPFLLPPASEQRAIVDYISSATSKIDKLISEKTKEMEYMKELRQRIISDAVTGKIDVRE